MLGFLDFCHVRGVAIKDSHIAELDDERGRRWKLDFSGAEEEHFNAWIEAFQEAVDGSVRQSFATMDSLFDLAAFQKLVEGDLGSLVSDAVTSDVFDYLADQQNFASRGSDEFSFADITSRRGRASSSFSGENAMLAAPHHASDLLPATVHDIEEGLSEPFFRTEQEMRRSVAGATHMAHQLQDAFYCFICQIT